MSAGSEQTEPAAPAPSTPPSQPAKPAVTTSMAAFGANDSCPNCGARMAADQRYCLNCGQRRGEPRLPFMDAVVFMESMGSAGAGAGSPPPPPSEQKSSPRMNANAALIAGVATLVLAIGVGFLIGRSGHENSTQAAAPQIIKVEGGSGGGESEAAVEEPTESATESSTGKSPKKSGSQANSPKTTPKAKENSQVGEHGASKATEEVLHTEGNVKLAPPEQEVGGACTKGTAGCGESGKFEGNFFGE